jgi:2-(1,2-epoxy-1,2-dihydrophenyl)acetyl-CoA isomerase
MVREAIATGTAELLAFEDDGVAVLTMNRPGARNALTREMVAGMGLALEYAETATHIRCVVITGAESAFCAGGDVKGMAERGRVIDESEPTIDERIHAQRLSQRSTSGRMFLMPKPVIASLPGPAAGAGLSLALAADLRIMADTAFITTAFATVGYSGDYGGSFFLTNLVGPGKAKELYFLSDRVDAFECERLGIANKVVAAEDLETKTMALARRLVDGPPVAYRYMKENINRAAMGGDVITCLDLESTHHGHTGQTEDHAAAARAFVDKTQVVFKGR